MKNKRGRPRNDDDNTLFAIARKIKADNGVTVRSAIVQCLPIISDSNIRRLQRKWRTEGTYFLNKVDDERPRVIDRTRIEIPRNYFSMVQEMRASIENVTAPMRHMQEAVDRMNAPFRQIHESLGIDMQAIHSAKRLAETLNPSVSELARQLKQFDLKSMMPDHSALQVMRSMNEMAKQIGVSR